MFCYQIAVNVSEDRAGVVLMSSSRKALKGHGRCTQGCATFMSQTFLSILYRIHDVLN